MTIQERVKKALERTTDTKELVIGKGALSRCAEVFSRMFPSKRAIVVADTNTWRVAGKQVDASLREAGIAVEQPFVFTDDDLYAEWRFVERLKAHLEKSEAIAVAVGLIFKTQISNFVNGVFKNLLDANF